MSTPGNPYYDQVRLLVQVLPFVGEEKCFALKGGTAINLFYRDLPRYSVDIDLAYLPGESYKKAQREIAAALLRVAKKLSSGSPSYEVALGKGTEEAGFDTLTVGGAEARIKVEVNPVLRGSLQPAQERQVQPAVAKEFGFAALQVLSFDDVFGGKLVAALDRQHPRDLFDVKLLLEAEGISDDLFKAFLVYLVGHKGSIPDVLDPLGKTVDIKGLYKGDFERMTVQPVSLKTLLETRERLAKEVRARLSADMKRFLLSVQNATPEWGLLNVERAKDLPAVKWRMVNLEKMNADSRKKELARLEKVLDR